MKHIIEMREKRANLLSQAREVHERSVNEKRDMTADENVQYDKIIAEMDSLKKVIDREERLYDEKKELEKRDGVLKIEGSSKEERKAKDKEQEYRSAYVKYLKGGFDNVTPEERSLIQEKRALGVGTTTLVYILFLKDSTTNYKKH